MVVVRMSPGLANQMYEFAAAYALAKELRQELVVDIAECIDSHRGYLLDDFKIPAVKKLTYSLDARKQAHTCISAIPAKIRRQATVLVEEQNAEGGIVYDSLKMAEDLREEAFVYLCGYFIHRDRYYLKYWDELRALFAFDGETREIAAFKGLIKGRVSVGIHIRRGDMLLAEWAVKMEDAYYRAAVECCRERFGEDCIFAVFSDDIEYAKKILGKDDSVYYIHFIGYDDAALNEFVCLSLCDHRILSNSSTFSRLADELNWKEERRVFWKATSQDEVGKLTNIDFAKRNIRLSRHDIERYDQQYRANQIDNLPRYANLVSDLLETDIDARNAEEILQRICRLSLQVYACQPETTQQLLYKKAIAAAAIGEYDLALQAAFAVYEKYSGEAIFQESLAQALYGIGAYEEAVVELIRLGYGEIIPENLSKLESTASLLRDLEREKKHFLIVPYCDMIASVRIIGLVKLGLVLRHLGHTVSFVLSPFHPLEENYISAQPYLTNRQGVCLGCRQYLMAEVKRQGIPEFLAKFSEDDIVIVSRRAEFFCDKTLVSNKKLQYIFPDFSDLDDEESSAGNNMEKEELEVLYRKADVVLTQREAFRQKEENYIVWESPSDQEAMPYRVKEGRWSLEKGNRLSRRAIYMAAALLKHIR